ncbi:MAG TPA: hypothetical protein VG839_06680 [Asticcacaulis sp.]|nr:hypothetical protein [Asticcacaulis sp.]
MKSALLAAAALGLCAAPAAQATVSSAAAGQQMANLLKPEPQAVTASQATYRTQVHAVSFGSLCQATDVTFALAANDPNKVEDLAAAPVFHALATPLTPVPRDQSAADQATTEGDCAKTQTSPAYFHADSARQAAKGVYILGRIPIVLPVIPVDCRQINGECVAAIRTFTLNGLTAISSCGRNEIDNPCWLYRYPTSTLEVYVNADYVPLKVIATRTKIPFDPIHNRN